MWGVKRYIKGTFGVLMLAATLGCSLSFSMQSFKKYISASVDYSGAFVSGFSSGVRKVAICGVIKCATEPYLGDSGSLLVGCVGVKLFDWFARKKRNKYPKAKLSEKKLPVQSQKISLVRKIAFDLGFLTHCVAGPFLWAYGLSWARK